MRDRILRKSNEPSCQISIASDGDVAFVVSDSRFVDCVPCSVTLDEGGVLLSQATGLDIRLKAVSEEFRNAIGNAGRLCLINVTDAGQPTERIAINRETSLTKESA